MEGFKHHPQHVWFRPWCTTHHNYRDGVFYFLFSNNIKSSQLDSYRLSIATVLDVILNVQYESEQANKESKENKAQAQAASPAAAESHGQYS